MELVTAYMLLLGFSLNGLIFIGMINRQRSLERRYLDAIKQLNVVALSRGNR